MGILDDAIKEHLELKRQHGADDSELKQLEDEAFGAAERPGEAPPPDPLAEAPTEFMTQPEVEEESPRSRRPDIADLQEAPPPPAQESPAEPGPPAEEESPAVEQAVPELPPGPEPEPEPEPSPEPEIPTGPTTEEREAIAEQPTEMFDVEEELASSSRAEAPSEEELVEEEMDEPRLAPVDPLAALEDDGEEISVAEVEDEEDDDFWDEKRLSDELDQALEAPVEVEEGEESLYEDAATEADEEPAPEPRPSAGEDEDVLEETPDFLEETPEDDQLWFEQKPPKDFDFDD